MRKFLTSGIVLGLALAASAPASAATTIFTDNFDNEPDGVPASSLANFDITQGTVDIVQTPQYGITCAGGPLSKCVDLDGTPGVGTILSKAMYSFVVGQSFTLDLLASGSQRGDGTNSFEYGFLLNGTTLATALGLNIASSAPFSPYSYTFTPDASGSLQVFVRGLGQADNQGVVIDNVALSAVPEPATWAMMLIGFGLAGWSLRRRQRKTAAFA